MGIYCVLYRLLLPIPNFQSYNICIIDRGNSYLQLRIFIIVSRNTMVTQHGEKPAHATQEPFRILEAASHVTIDSLNRVTVVVSRIIRIPTLSFAALLPKALAGSTFVPRASNDSVTVQDVESMISMVFDFKAWKARGDHIRSAENRVNCIGNLSMALSQVGPLLAAELNGAAGALSLLPTAGALIGAPAKELWVLYKLMPLAGVLSMLLSLGGNIVPTQTSDYKLKTSAFSYDGFIATSHAGEGKDEADDLKDLSCSDAKKFAKRVERRANKPRGEMREMKRLAVGFGIGLQLFWLVVLLAACWFLQSGSVVAWWCQVSANSQPYVSTAGPILILSLYSLTKSSNLGMGLGALLVSNGSVLLPPGKHRWRPFHKAMDPPHIQGPYRPHQRRCPRRRPLRRGGRQRQRLYGPHNYHT